MAIKYYYRDEAGDMTEIVGQIRAMSLDCTENAEEGSVAMWTLEVDDPDMDWSVSGHRLIVVEESSSSVSDKYIAIGYTADRRVVRSEDGLSRRWLVDVVDLNSVLTRRFLKAESANRSAETDVARVTWAESSAEGSLVADDYLLAADPVDMDAVDYRGQYVFDVLRDCAEHTGKNFYVTHFYDGVDDPWHFALWYGDPGEEDYESTARLTNVAGDISSTTFMVVSAELRLDPSRIYSDIRVPYTDAYVDGYDPTTATTYARRGAVMPAVNVKSKAKALARLGRFLEDAATEDERITVVVRVPRADVNLIRPGMRVEAKFIHLPGYDSDYTFMRVLNRQVTEPNLRQYELRMELSPPAAPTVGAGEDVYGVLRMTQGPNSDVVYFGFPGDTPGPGYPVQPTEGLLEVIEDLTPPNAAWPYTGWKVTGTGTVDVTFFATTAGVLIDNNVYSITYAIRLNGVVVASEAVNVSGFLQFHAHEQLVTIAGLAVVPDDVIDATITCIPPTMPFFRTPLASGQNGERLEITGGTLV